MYQSSAKIDFFFLIFFSVKKYNWKSDFWRILHLSVIYFVYWLLKGNFQNSTLERRGGGGDYCSPPCDFSSVNLELVVKTWLHIYGNKKKVDFSEIFFKKTEFLYQSLKLISGASLNKMTISLLISYGVELWRFPLTYAFWNYEKYLVCLLHAGKNLIKKKNFWKFEKSKIQQKFLWINHDLLYRTFASFLRLGSILLARRRDIAWGYMIYYH